MFVIVKNLTEEQFEELCGMVPVIGTSEECAVPYDCREAVEGFKTKVVQYEDITEEEVSEYEDILEHNGVDLTDYDLCFDELFALFEEEAVRNAREIGERITRRH